MLRRLYNWTLEKSAHPRALWVLIAVSFLESSIFPIPPDVLLVPMILAVREKAWLYAGVATVASVAGGILGYTIGQIGYDTVGRMLLEYYSAANDFVYYQEIFNEFGGWIVFAAGLTPFPYKVITIASGVAEMDFAHFVLASIAGRGLRFFLLAVMLYEAGRPIEVFIDKYFGLLSTFAIIVLIGSLVVFGLK